MMRGPKWFAWAACFLIATLAAPGARAGRGGMIVFVGAIVESTCDTADTPDTPDTSILEANAAGKSRPLRQTCPDPTGAGASATARRPYSMRVVRLTTSEHDRMLRYFVHYVRADHSGSASPVLVIRTYE